MSEPDQFRNNLNLKTICNSFYLHYTQGKLLWHLNINIWDSDLVLRNPYSGLWPYSEKSVLDSVASNMGLHGSFIVI